MLLLLTSKEKLAFEELEICETCIFLGFIFSGYIWELRCFFLVEVHLHASAVGLRISLMPSII